MYIELITKIRTFSSFVNYFFINEFRVIVAELKDRVVLRTKVTILDLALLMCTLNFNIRTSDYFFFEDKFMCSSIGDRS